MAEVGLPLQGKIEFWDRKPWALPTAKIALRFQRVERKNPAPKCRVVFTE
jgi:hypothetical protein